MTTVIPEKDPDATEQIMRRTTKDQPHESWTHWLIGIVITDVPYQVSDMEEKV
jgi:hypothetical protein